jgi:hypothetical protein
MKGRHRIHSPPLTARLATVAMTCVLALTGCGGDESKDEAADDSRSAAATALYEEIADLGDEEQIKRVGAAWAEPFARGDEIMCDYLHPDIAGGCSKFVQGALTRSGVIQKSYAGATVRKVEVNGDASAAEFSNGEQVDFEKDPNDEWKITRTSRATGP